MKALLASIVAARMFHRDNAWNRYDARAFQPRYRTGFRGPVWDGYRGGYWDGGYRYSDGYRRSPGYYDGYGRRGYNYSDPRFSRDSGVRGGARVGGTIGGAIGGRAGSDIGAEIGGAIGR